MLVAMVGMGLVCALVAPRPQWGCLSPAEIAESACVTHRDIPPQPTWCYPTNVQCSVEPRPASRPTACTPGSLRCEGDFAQVCADGGWTNGVRCGGNGWTCCGGKCVGPCECAPGDPLCSCCVDDGSQNLRLLK